MFKILKNLFRTASPKPEVTSEQLIEICETNLRNDWKKTLGDERGVRMFRELKDANHHDYVRMMEQEMTYQKQFNYVVKNFS